MIGQMPKHHKRSKNIYHFDLRDRPFNLQGGYGFLFHSEFFFRTTQELEYLFFCRAKRKFFFQNSTSGYMTKTESDYLFFFLHQNQNIFLEKKT